VLLEEARIQRDTLGLDLRNEFEWRSGESQLYSTGKLIWSTRNTIHHVLEAAEPSFTFHGHDDEEHNTAELRKVGTGTSMHRVPSSKPSVNNIRSVPNGGTKAWLQVLASFFLFFNSWGIVNTFGMFRHEPSEAIQFC
jgi:hypothetical protein